ncbi:MAG: phosphotransferase, partial [Gemmataceae bacterium]|nr:phosphotransferase [Gemmataceae bacterium]
MTTQPIPTEVLPRYGPAVAGLRWVPLGAAGGLSGAALWRGDDADRPLLALKAWPPPTTADRLAAVHALMRRAGHLPFVPAVLPAAENSTVVEAAGRVWDLCRWMPGSADTDAAPRLARAENAAAALAAVHRAWASPTPRHAPCPAVRRRLDALAEFRRYRHVLERSTVLGDAVRRAADVVARLGPAAEVALRPWADRSVPVRPCLVDARRDHVLFTGDAVTGLVDYGAVQDDHPAADLARLLGELAGEDDRLFAAGLAAHAAA